MVLLLFITITPPVEVTNTVLASSLKGTTYTVYFNSNGGTYVSPIYNVPYGTTIELPNTPYRYGYWFRGWYSNSGLTIPFDMMTKVTGTTYLYAKWEQKSSNYPEILTQTVSDSTVSATFTVDINGQDYGYATEMNISLIDKSKVEDAVHEINLTNTFFAFELDIKDLLFDPAKPLPVKVSIPSGYDKSYVSVFYTANRKTIMAKMNGYVNTSNQYVFDAYTDGSYILMVCKDDASTVTNPTAYLRLTTPPTISVDGQVSIDYEFVNFTGDESEYDLIWYSSDTDIASVSKDGIVTGKSSGTATITCYSSDGTFTAQTKAVVKGIAVTSITPNVTKKTLTKGKSFQLKVTVAPSTATNKKLSYRSSNKSVATVSSTGKITAKKKGTCTITVKTTDGSNKTKKIKITVK